ncbi:cyclic nucleotide-binding domain-containing protein [Thermodesulfobacteriota bacterium]
MLEEILNDPDLAKYMITRREGQIIFLEGDDSQDLHILVSGHVDIIKGNQKISEIKEEGALFGEMSFFLGDKRTATVKAATDVNAICIPKDEVTTFLKKFPEVVQEITRLLAQRLEETSMVVYGLREFCDQLPDAVILTDREGKILSWNRAAEKLYGWEWHQMRYKSVTEIYEDPAVYSNFIEEVQSKYAVREKVLKVMHPEIGLRLISTSTTVLYDGHHNFQGVLSLGRDVTAIQQMEQRYRRARYWVLPALILFALLITTLYFGYPYFSKGYQAVDEKRQEMRTQLAKDFLLLRSLLTSPFEAGNRSKTSQMMHDFFEIQGEGTIPYRGLVLLDAEKNVFDAYSLGDLSEARNLAGNSYTGIVFMGGKKSIHHVLTLYRVSKEHPMGHKQIEIAFKLYKDDRFLGWISFQMDMDVLKSEYGLDEKGLLAFRIREP